MKTNSLRRWCRPKVILVVSTLTESPAHTLRVISGLRTTGSRLFLAQLPAVAYTISQPGRDVPLLLAAATKICDRQPGTGAGQDSLWAEILSEVTVLRNTPVDRIPALAEALAADMVALTTPDIGRMPFRASNDDLFGSLHVPILVCGVRMRMSSWNWRELRKILVPVAFGTDLELQMRFACRFARRHRCRVTVLHVFESRGEKTQGWDRTPVAVEKKLPISELNEEGILCPLEVTVCEGYPEQKILSFNEQKPHDLILMGGPQARKWPQGIGSKRDRGGNCRVSFAGAHSRQHNHERSC